MNVTVPAGAKELKVGQVVGRACEVCGGPPAVDPATGGLLVVDGHTVCRDCGSPTSHEDLGTTVYWHRNPLRRLAWRLHLTRR